MICEVMVRTALGKLAHERVEASSTMAALLQVLQKPGVCAHLNDLKYGAITAHVMIPPDLVRRAEVPMLKGVAA
jgi:hypothetical protein